MKSKIELESMFDNAQTMHLQEFINYYTPDTTNTGTVTGGELLELNLSSLLHTLNDGNDVLLKADSNWPEILTQLKQQLSSLQADNERLRSALGVIRDILQRWDTSGKYTNLVEHANTHINK